MYVEMLVAEEELLLVLVAEHFALEFGRAVPGEAERGGVLDAFDELPGADFFFAGEFE